MGRTEGRGTGSHRCPGCGRGVYVADHDSVLLRDDKDRPVWWHTRCLKVDEKARRKAERDEARRVRRMATAAAEREEKEAKAAAREARRVAFADRYNRPTPAPGLALAVAIHEHEPDDAPALPEPAPDPVPPDPEDVMTDEQMEAICARVQTRVEDALVGMLADAERQITEARTLAGRASVEAGKAFNDLRSQIKTFAATYEERFQTLTDNLLSQIADGLDPKRIADAIERERDRQRQAEMLIELRARLYAHLKENPGVAHPTAQLATDLRTTTEHVVSALTISPHEALVVVGDGRAFMWFE